MALFHWSTTANDNDDADPTINARENWAPRLVNNSMRAMMAAIAKWRDDTSGLLETTGSASAYTLTTASVYSSLIDGMKVAFRAHATNSAGPTFNVDGQGAKPLRFYTGASLAAGRLLIGSKYTATYRSSSDEWLIDGADGALDGVTTAGVAMLEAADAAAQAALLGLNTTFMASMIGVTMDYAGTTAPNGWLLCYGQEVSRSTYTALDAVLGTTFGAYTDGSGGVGTTHLRLPDLRGRVVAGQDDMGGVSADRLTSQTGSASLNGDTLGAAGGAQSHALSSGENGAHAHFGVAGAETSNEYGGGEIHVARIGRSGSSNERYNLAYTSVTPNEGVSSTSGSGTAHNNVQPTIILNKMIFTGVFS